MDRTVELLLRQMAEALKALRDRPGAPEAAQLDALETIRRDSLLPALAADDMAQAAAAARALELKVAELPLPEVALSSALRADVLALQVELLRTAAGLHHALDTRV